MAKPKRIGRPALVTDEIRATIVHMHFTEMISAKDIEPRVPVGITKVYEVIAAESEVRRRLAEANRTV